MKHLRLIAPNLIPPKDIADEVCAGLELPALEKLLARGKANNSPAETLEDKLCAAFGVQSVAPIRAAADGLEIGEGYWLCADPVNLQLHRAQMMLLPEVMLSGEEAAALCDSLNEHFSEMGLRFFAPHPQRWYLQVDAEPQLTTTPLSRAAWSDAKFHQPQGRDALHWQRIITELQMVLYAHPLNQAREARGELIVSSLWLWGGGRAQPLSAGVDAVGGESELAATFARVAGVQQIESFTGMLDGHYENGLWVCDMAGNALQRGDLYAWREAVQQVERECARPLLKALQGGRLRRVTLEVLGENNARSFVLTRGNALKLWVAGRSLARYAV
jgi:hypothetical protein